jgi:hypothetical protein
LIWINEKGLSTLKSAISVNYYTDIVGLTITGGSRQLSVGLLQLDDNLFQTDYVDGLT